MERENEVFHIKDGSWYLEDCEGRPNCCYTQVDGVVVNKSEKYWTKDDKENMQRSLKAKTVITTTLSLDEIL